MFVFTGLLIICMIAAVLSHLVRAVAPDQRMRTTESMAFIPVANMQMAREKSHSYGALILRPGEEDKRPNAPTYGLG
jgi:hypothetical protein